MTDEERELLDRIMEPISERHKREAVEHFLKDYAFEETEENEPSKEAA